jgi:hypothetical protein
VERLGGSMPAVSETEYDRLVVVTTNKKGNSAFLRCVTVPQLTKRNLPFLRRSVASYGA